MCEQVDRTSAERSPTEWMASLPGNICGGHLRLACREYLQRYAVPRSDLDAAELIFAELAGNVWRHAAGIGSFHIDWRHRRPTLVVIDEGPGFGRHRGRPYVRDPLAESGRGLDIVRALARDVDYGDRLTGGAFVHLTLPVERATAVTLVDPIVKLAAHSAFDGDDDDVAVNDMHSP